MASALDSEQARSESITLRINKRFLDSLRTESGEKEISLNTLMNQMIKHHIYWHSIAPKVGFISVRKDLITELFENRTEEEVIALGHKMGKNKTRDLFFLTGNELNIMFGLEMIETWIRASGFSYKRQVNGVNYACTIEHDMGKKWSLYLTEIFRFIFDAFSLKAVFESTDSALRFQIELA